MSRVEGTRTVYAIEPVGVAEGTAGAGECSSSVGIACYGGEILASFATSADGQEDFEMRVLSFKRNAGAETTLVAGDFEFVVRPVVAKLCGVSVYHAYVECATVIHIRCRRREPY